MHLYLFGLGTHWDNALGGVRWGFSNVSEIVTNDYLILVCALQLIHPLLYNSCVYATNFHPLPNLM